jgi:nitrite reductase/ring-hydroxylating ferredoxin subunit
MTAPQDFSVGRVEEVPPGSKKIVEVGGRSVGVFNSGGNFYAVQNLCPHALAPICLGNLSGTNMPTGPGEEFVYGMEGQVLRCIWHGWEFDVSTGQALFGTDRRRLATFPVRVEGGDVIVTMRPRRMPDESLSDAVADTEG